MRRFLLLLVPILGLVFLAPVSASAQSLSSTVTLSGIVAPMRFIYVDQSGAVIKIVGNTSDNVAPKVASLDNKLLPMTDSVWQQYIAFMDQHSWRLAAEQSYNVNPVQVKTEVSSQIIEINNQAQVTFSSSQLQAALTPEFG